MAAIFAGVGVEQIEPREVYSPRTGLLRFPRWKGNPDLMLSLKAQIRALGFGYSTSWDGAYEIIEADFPEDETIPSNTPLSDDWKLKRNLVERDIWLLPKVQVEMDKITSDPGDDRNLKRRMFKSDFEALLRGETTTTDSTGAEIELTFNDLMVIAGLFGCDTSVFEGLYDEMTKGVRSFLVTEWVLHRTTVTNRYSTVKASKENCNAIFTTAGLQTTESIASDVKFELPEGFWLKTTPEVEQLARGRWEIIQEFWFGERYSAFLYGAPVA